VTDVVRHAPSAARPADTLAIYLTVYGLGILLGPVAKEGICPPHDGAKRLDADREPRRPGGRARMLRGQGVLAGGGR
jgi:hypothetical protein